MGSRTSPNHGGSGLPHSRICRPKPQPAEPIKYEPIRTLHELELYLSGLKIACLICGIECKSLGHHLSQSHSMSSKDYKVMFNIPVTRSLCCQDLKERKRKITQGFWQDNPKRESVRCLLKSNIKNLDGYKHKSKSTIQPSKESRLIAAKKRSDAFRKKYREIYLSIIDNAINSGETIYQLTLNTSCKPQAIYSFAERNNDDSYFCERLALARQIPTRERKRDDSGKYLNDI